MNMPKCAFILIFSLPIKCITIYSLAQANILGFILKYSTHPLISPHPYADCFPKTYTNSVQFYLDSCHSVPDALHSLLIDVLTSTLYYSVPALPPSCEHNKLPSTSTSTCLHISFFCTLIYCTLQMLRFSQIKGLWQPCIEQVYQCLLTNSTCCLYITMSQFCNSHNISNFFTIIVCVMVIFDVTIIIFLRHRDWHPY